MLEPRAGPDSAVEAGRARPRRALALLRRSLLATLAVAIASTSSVLSATPAPAATLTVPSLLYPTIQSAVSGATPGDLVKVKPGVYFENVTVDTAGITISGVCTDIRQVIVDAAPAGADGIGFDVNAPDVTLKCLSIRHGTVGVDVDADQFTLQRVRLINQRVGASLELTGDGFTIQGSSFEGAQTYGLDVRGSNGHISGNESRGHPLECFLLHVHNTTIESNVAEICEAEDGFDLAGNNNILIGNKVKASEDSCYDLVGDRNVLSNNICLSTSDVGFAIAGSDVTLRSNTARHADDSCYKAEGRRIRLESNSAYECGRGGFSIISEENPVLISNQASWINNGFGYEIVCILTCDDSRIIGNQAVYVNDAHDGFYIAAMSGGMLVKGNTSRRSMDGGFFLDLDNAFIQENQSLYNGTNGDSGFYITGDSNLITGNVARANADDGFTVAGDNNVLSENLAESNAVDGFDIQSDFDGVGAEGNTLSRNAARGNYGEGIENGGLATVLIANVARRNRVDCVNNTSEGATIASSSGNTCADGSDFTSEGSIDFSPTSQAAAR